MASLNKIMLIGNCTRDPQLKYLPNQTAICEFGFAINREYKGADGTKRQDVTFIDCKIFGKLAEVFNQYMSKGKPAYLEGRLSFEQWEDKNGGGKRSKHVATIDSFQFLASGQKQDGKPETQEKGETAPAEPPYTGGDQPQFSDDDIPF